MGVWSWSDPWPLFWLKVLILQGLFFFARYLLVAGLAQALLVWKGAKLHPVRIYPDGPPTGQKLREFGWSLVTFWVFGFTGVVGFSWTRLGYTQLYREVHRYGPGYLVFSLVLLVFFHDAYFYWLHRLMHRPNWYWVHQRHHQFRRPTPWASFAFGPVEAFLLSWVVPLALCLFPLHPWTVLAFLWFMTVMNVIGHLGVELYPSGLLGRWGLRLLNTATHHGMHHGEFNCNYGFYFNSWDRWLGTNHPLYEEKVKAILAARSGLGKKDGPTPEEPTRLQEEEGSG